MNLDRWRTAVFPGADRAGPWRRAVGGTDPLIRQALSSASSPRTTASPPLIWPRQQYTFTVFSQEDGHALTSCNTTAHRDRGRPRAAPKMSLSCALEPGNVLCDMQGGLRLLIR